MKAQEIDILLGTPARLAVMASLAGAGALTFTQLRLETGLADGNLHVQTKRLLVAGYLDAGKTQSGNRTLTSFQLTNLGREKYVAHIRMLAKAISGVPDLPRFSGRSLGKTGEAGSSSKDKSQVW